MRTALCITVILICSPAAFSKKPLPASNPPVILLTPKEAAKIKAYTPQPEYPIAARIRHETGSGMFRLHVQLQTGQVKKFEIEHSTGHSVPDVAIKNALVRWRFKPAGLRAYGEVHDEELIVRVPITYAMP